VRHYSYALSTLLSPAANATLYFYATAFFVHEQDFLERRSTLTERTLTLPSGQNDETVRHTPARDGHPPSLHGALAVLQVRSLIF